MKVKWCSKDLNKISKCAHKLTNDWSEQIACFLQHFVNEIKKKFKIESAASYYLYKSMLRIEFISLTPLFSCVQMFAFFRSQIMGLEASMSRIMTQRLESKCFYYYFFGPFSWGHVTVFHLTNSNISKLHSWPMTLTFSSEVAGLPLF